MTKWAPGLYSLAISEQCTLAVISFLFVALNEAPVTSVMSFALPFCVVVFALPKQVITGWFSRLGALSSN